MSADVISLRDHRESDAIEQPSPEAQTQEDAELENWAKRLSTPQGFLVVIGATNREDGLPVPTDALQITTPMFVGWTRRNPTDLMDDLQRGNHRQLAIYGSVPATYEQAQELYHVIDPDFIRGNWFQVWKPMIAIIRLLRGEPLTDDRQFGG